MSRRFCLFALLIAGLVAPLLPTAAAAQDDPPPATTSTTSTTPPTTEPTAPEPAAPEPDPVPKPDPAPTSAPTPAPPTVHGVDAPGAIRVSLGYPNDHPQDFVFRGCRVDATATCVEGPYEFTLDTDSTDATHDRTVTFPNLEPGDYLVEIDAIPGWAFNTITCSGVSTVDLAHRRAWVTVASGATSSCNYSATPSILTITHDGNPDDPQDFHYRRCPVGGGTCETFIVDDDGDGTNRMVFNDILPGTYTIEQLQRDGWGLVDLECLPDQAVDLAAHTVTVTVLPGRTVDCNFKTVQTRLTIEQSTAGDDPQDFGFTGCQGAGTSQCGLFSLDDDGETDATLAAVKFSPGLAPGVYTVTQDAVPGWGLTAITCTGTGGRTIDLSARRLSVTLAPGDDLRCKFANQQGRVRLVLQNAPSHPQDFEFTACREQDGACQTVTLDDDLGSPETSAAADWRGLDAGTYTITEALPNADWGLIEIRCGSEAVDVITRHASITLSPGEFVTCTFVNRISTVTVQQTATPSGLQTFTYETCLPGGHCSSINLGSSVAGGSWPTTQDLPYGSGTYVITQGAVTDWALTQLQCTGGWWVVADRKATLTVTGGQQITCFFTNQRTSLTVVEDSGDAQDFGFSACPQPTGSCSAFALDDDSSNSPLSDRRQWIGTGAYVITQDAVGGWGLSALTCTGGGTTVDRSARQVTVQVDPGAQIVCTFTNRPTLLTVVLDTNPSSTTDFGFTGCAPGGSCSSFTLDDDSDAALPATRELRAGPAGSYEITQNAFRGYSLDALTCTGVNGVVIDLPNRRATVPLTDGDQATCTFRLEPTSVTISLQAEPHDAQDFSFTFCGPTGPCDAPVLLDDDSNATLTASQFVETYAGIQTIDVAPVGGWIVSSISCAGGSSGVVSDPANGHVRLTLTPGDHPTCTFNIKQTRLTLVLNSVPDDPQDFSFEHCAPGGACTPVTLDDDPADGTRLTTYVAAGTAPGVHTLTQTGDPARWKLTNISCTTGTIDLANRTAAVTLSAGQSVTCTFQDSATQLDVNVATPGENALDFSFSRCGPGGECTPFSLDDDPADTTLPSSARLVPAEPGTYTITLDPLPSGWGLSSIACTTGQSDLPNRRATITVALGQQLSCTFNIRTTRLTLAVDALSATAGTDPQDFTFTACRVATSQCGPYTLDDDAGSASPPASVVFDGLEPGAYTVAQDLVAGWGLTGVSCGSAVLAERRTTVTMNPGDQITCTFTNRQTAIGVAVTASDDSDQPFTFLQCGPTAEACHTYEATGDADHIEATPDGSYSVALQPEVGWRVRSLSCTNVTETLDQGDTRATFTLPAGVQPFCTFTMDRTSITVVTDTVPNAATDVAYELCPASGPCEDALLDDDSDATLPRQLVWPALAEGTYTLTQTDLGGGAVTTLSCTTGETIDLEARRATIVLEPGEEVTCTFVNRLPALTVVLDAVPNNAQDVTFDACSVATGGCTAFILDDDSNSTRARTVTFGGLAVGSYTVTMTAVSGWQLTGVACDTGETPDLPNLRVHVTLTPGESSTCTFTHTQGA